MWANYSKIIGDASYFLLVFDGYSRYMWVELLKTKDQALDCFKKIKTRAEVESGGKLKALRTDRGGEFTSNLFTMFCSEGGIKHYTTTPYSAQHNGVVEIRNQTVVEMARCMMKSMQVPSEFWGEAVCIAVYVLNRAPTKALNNMTPFEAWHGRKLNVEHLRIFGYTANVKLVGPNLTKLSDRSRKMIFIGYEIGTKGYRFYDPTTAKLVVSRDVLFSENEPWTWTNADGSTIQPTNTFTIEYELPDRIPTTDGNTEEMQQPADSGFQQDPTDQGGDVPSPHSPHTPETNPTQNQGWEIPSVQNFANSKSSDDGPVRFRTLTDLFEHTDVFTDFEYSGVCMLAADEPTNIEQALEEKCWREAMDAEMQ